MSTVTHVRPKKDDDPPPSITAEEVILKTPPTVPHKPPATGMQRFGPALLVIAVVTIVIVGGKSGMFSRGIGMFLPFMLLIGMVMMFTNRGGDKKQEIVKERADYLRYVDDERDDAIEAAEKQFAVAKFHYPRPQELVGKIGATSALMWSRRADSKEFMHARIGLGTEKAARWFQRLDVGAMEDQEPACVQAINDLIHEHSFVRDIARPISLAEQPAWALTGDPEAVLASARAMLAHLMFFHGPDDLMIAVVVDEDRAGRWDAVKWLPHHRFRGDLLTFGSVEELVDALDEEVRGRGQHVKRTMKGTGSQLSSSAGQGGRSTSTGAPVKHLVVLCDSAAADWDQFMIDGLGREATTVLDLSGQCPLVTSHTTLHFGGGEVSLAPMSGGGPAFLAVPDAMSLNEWEAFVRKLSRYRQGRKASRVLAESGDTESSLDLMELLNVADAANWDPGEMWKWASSKRNLLRVPVGRYLDSLRLWIIDLKEGAQGPHFGVAGGTGAGKSDFLRTLVLALCMTHSPEDLIITPADFKGRKTFAGFERLPHVLVVLNNLDSSPDRIARLRQVFQGELIRRQKLLELAGDQVNDIDQYRAFRRKHPELNLPPMPHWFIPFDELMQAKREAPDLLAIMKIVGTVGRSLGAHMMPVSQTFNPGLMEGIDPHLTGRLGMKMHRTQDYRDILGSSSPGALPKRPGVGYFVEDPEASIPPQRVEDCYVRKAYVPPSEAAKEEESRGIREHFKPRLLSAAGDEAARAIESTYTAADLPDAGGPEDEALDEDDVVDADAGEAPGEEDEEDDDDQESLAQTVMSVAIDVMETYVRENNCALEYDFWLPELTSYTPVSTYVQRFLAEHGRPGPEDLVAPAGVVDLPRDLSQDVLKVYLRQNAVICGGPESGKSLAAASIVLGAAQMYSPERVQFYILDNGGGKLQFLENLAHVGEVVRGTGDRYAVDRMLTHMWSLFRKREAEWARARVDIGQWRRRRFGGEAGYAPDDGHGDVYFVIDQADTVCAEFPEHKENILLPLAKRGPGYGIHLIFTQASKAGSMHKFADDFGHLFELKMADSLESAMMRQNAEAVPSFPGRGLISAEGTSGARRSSAAAMANLNESIPPDSAHHILFAAPRIGVDGGELAGAQACQFVNEMYPGAVPAPAIPQLPDHVAVSDLAEARPGQFRLGLRESDLSTQFWTPEVDGHLVVMGDAKCGKTTALRMLASELDAYASAAPADNKPIIVVFDLRRTMLGAIQTSNLAPGGYVYQTSQVQGAVQYLSGLVADRASDEVLDQDELLRRQAGASATFEGPEIFILIDDYEGFIVGGFEHPFDPLNAVIEMGARSGVRLIASHTKNSGVWQMGRGLLPRVAASGAPVLLMSDKDLTSNLYGKVKGMVLQEGRGLYIERGGSMMVQVASPEGQQ